jgi:hypothetical protein
MTTSIHRRSAAPAIAFVAAGALAVAPVAVSPPDHPLASPRAVISHAVHLSAFVSPIETWTQVVQQAVTNLTILGPQLTSTELYQELAGIGTSYATALVSGALSSVAGGNPAPLINTVSALVGQAAYGALTAVTTEFSAPSLALHAQVVLAPVQAGAQALLTITQSLLSAVAAGDLTTAASVLVNAPAVLTDAVVNDGLLNPVSGSLASLVAYRSIFMEALKAFSPGAVTNSTADPSVVPNLAATTLTVSNTTVPSAKSAITEDLSETKNAATGPASQLPTSSHQPVDKTAASASAVAVTEPDAKPTGAGASETTTTSSTQNPDIEPSRDAPTVTAGSKSAPTGASSLADGNKTSPRPKRTSATSSGAAQADSAAGSVTKSSDGDKNGAGTGGEAGDKAGDKQ